MREVSIDRTAAVVDEGVVLIGVLTSFGFDATNVAGGTSAWIRSGRPIEK